MNSREITKEALSLIERAPRCFLATVGLDGAPDVRTMLNLRCRAGFARLGGKFAAGSFKTYLPAHAGSGKLMQLRQNPKASVYYTDPNTCQSLLVAGTCENVEREAVKDEFWQPEWTRYFEGGKDGGQYALIAFHPRRLKYYDGKQNSYELDVS